GPVAAVEAVGPRPERARYEPGEAGRLTPGEPGSVSFLPEPLRVLNSAASEPVVEHSPRLLERMISGGSHFVNCRFIFRLVPVHIPSRETLQRKLHPGSPRPRSQPPVGA